MHETSKIEVIKDTYILDVAIFQVQSPNSSLEMEDRTHKNLEDQHPSASSLKLYQNLKDKHLSACSLKFKYQNLKDRHPSARSLKKYVKEINGEVEI